MKIVLLCNQGMSTSLLVERMKEAAEKLGESASIEAQSADSFEEQVETADVILLGPQIRYRKNEFLPQAEKANVTLGIVDMSAYGMIDGEKVLKQALELYQKNA